jgi:hypothetical protein
MNHIAERDWKRLRSIHDAALDELCGRILAAARTIIDRAETGKAHAAYLELGKAIDEWNDTVSLCFDDLRRSTAALKLLQWRRNGLLPDERLREFSEDIQESIRHLDHRG